MTGEVKHSINVTQLYDSKRIESTRNGCAYVSYVQVQFLVGPYVFSGEHLFALVLGEGLTAGQSAGQLDAFSHGSYVS